MNNLTQEQKEILKIKDNRVNHYFVVENAVIDDHSVFSDIYESHLFIILSRYCNNGQIAFPSYNTLANQCYCSRRTIIKAMNSLIEKGLVNKISRKKEVNNENDTNYYTVNNLKTYEIKEKENLGGASCALGSVSGAPEVVHTVHHPSAGGAPNKQQYINNQYKKNNTKKNCVLFDKFLKEIETIRSNKFLTRLLTENNLDELFEITQNKIILKRLFEILSGIKTPIMNFNYIKGVLNNLLAEKEITNKIDEEKLALKKEKEKREAEKAQIKNKIEERKGIELARIKAEYNQLTANQKGKLEIKIGEAYKKKDGDISHLINLKESLPNIYENFIANILLGILADKKVSNLSELSLS